MRHTFCEQNVNFARTNGLQCFHHDNQKWTEGEAQPKGGGCNKEKKNKDPAAANLVQIDLQQTTGKALAAIVPAAQPIWPRTLPGQSNTEAS